MSQKPNIVKINELQGIIDLFVQRQKEIRVDIRESEYIDFKNNRDIERKVNTALLRICYWMLMELKGYSFEKKLSVDTDFPYWIRKPYGYYCNGAVFGILNLSENDSWKGLYGNKYCHPMTLYYILLDKLFPKTKGGLFSFNEYDNVENTVWRDRFIQLLKTEPDEYNEYRYRLRYDVRSY